MSKEALKLALEAMNLARAAHGQMLLSDPPQEAWKAWGVSAALTKAMTAASEALAEQGCDYCNHPQYAGTKCKNCGREQPAQQREPIRVPVTDNTYGYAKSLAEAIFKQHFASDEHYASGRIVWGVNDTVIGILTQIDNMVADMVRRPAQQQEPEKDWGAIGQAHLVALKKSSRELMEEAAVRVVHKMAQQQEPVAWMKDCADFWEHYTYISEASQENYKAEAQMWVEKLRTSPPASKPWVGLTDEEFEEIELGCRSTLFGKIEAMRKVEAKLREKNAPQQSKEDA